jgi:hypothetical protein
MPGPGKVEDFDWIVRVEVFEFVNKLTHRLINSDRQWTLMDSRQKGEYKRLCLEYNARPLWLKKTKA